MAKIERICKNFDKKFDVQFHTVRRKEKDNKDKKTIYTEGC